MKQTLGQKPEYRLLSAPNASQGIDLARAHKPDLILMDINLPGMNGIEAHSQLQKFKETRNIPVIAISANAMQADIDHALAKGFKGYLTKPINIKNFFAILKQCLAEASEQAREAS
jgi:CheY-like chemotaxis protein